ncbi:MAG: hypothetical protein Q9174_004196, partial [Haloplaca sp. 1 TL-2023]
MKAFFDDPSLTAEDEASLMEDGIILQKSSDGKRKVSAALLTPPSFHPGSISPNPSTSSTPSVTASVRFKVPHTADYTFTLPEHSESAAAAEFCGFIPETAKEIYDRVVATRCSCALEPDLLDFMIGRTDIAKPRRSNPDLPPREAMNMIGISHWLQDAILDERFKDVWQTQTTIAWVEESIETSYNTMLQLQQRLKARAIYSQRSKKKKKRSSFQQPGLEPSGSEWNNPPGSATTVASSEGAWLWQFHNLHEAHVAV